MTFSNARQFTGTIKSSETVKSTPTKLALTGRIRARAETIKAAKPPREDRPIPVKPPYTAIHGGVSTHAVTLNSLQPHQQNLTAWDVLTFPYVTFTEPFSQYVLPNPSLKIKDYFQNPGLEFDSQCLIGKLGPHMPNAGDWNTYAIRCRVQLSLAGIQGALTNQQIAEFLSKGTNLGYAVNVSVVGPGVFANNSLTATAVGTIKRNVVLQNADGSSRVETVTDRFEVENVMAPGNDLGTHVDLTFYSVRGAPWQAVAVRLS